MELNLDVFGCSEHKDGGSESESNTEACVWLYKFHAAAGNYGGC